MAFPKRILGFTLIEMLIVVTIVAILAAIAFPSYIDQIRTARRADAKAVLMAAAEFMERFYTENGRYDQTAEGTAVADQLPYDKSPIDSGDNFYGITVQSADATSYRLRATPTNGTSQEGDGLMEINNLGQRFWDQNADGDLDDPGEDDWDR